MALSKRRIGDLITVVDERNVDGFKYPFFGINISKEFMPSVANTSNVDNRKYKIIRKDRFVFSGMQTGRDNCIRIGIYTKEDCVLVSPAYTTFEVTSPDILPLYFFMIFNSKEKDRYGAFLSDSSVRANLDWDRFCDIEIDVPSKPVQEKYVAIYKGLLTNLASYEKGLDDLKTVCDGYIEDLRRKQKPEEIGPYMVKSEKNTDEKYTKVLGVGQSGFISPQKKPNESLKNYKVITKNAVCYAPPLYNILSDAIHVYTDEEPAVCSPIYEVFYCGEGLNPEYLLLWLKRNEFKRYAEFYALGVRNTFDYDLMKEVRIPIPSKDIQKRIVDIFHTLKKRNEFIVKLKNEISNICPVLVRGSILEAEGKR